ncbi:hypothetical protein DFP72DRAFT_904793 [Ephemerocybe angulata]|uniref:Uncharacterized protein n=1 Tax=Ephemerocybe angulata TaxID=980116 RepID=A0A8H6HSK1_9AGAR|nr:hypothetical protein DFP72DRAFT_904793 [Tulosesus angulatus]
MSASTAWLTSQASDPVSTAPPRGLFIDFDHATPEIMKERVPNYKTYPSMHSMPFMAMNLLNGDAKTPLYRHGLEAFLWSTVMYCALGRDAGKLNWRNVYRLEYKWYRWAGSLVNVYWLKKECINNWHRGIIMDLDNDAPPKVGPLPFRLDEEYPRDAVLGVEIPFEGLTCSVLRCLATWTGMRKPEFHQEQDDRYYMQLVENEFPCEHESKEWMDFKLEMVPDQPTEDG